MELISDILLGSGALLTAAYCFVLSRKIGKLKGLDQDLGGAIAVLSQQVDQMNSTLVSARESTANSSGELQEKTLAAKETADRLELLLAALHDLPDPETAADQALEQYMEPSVEQQNVFVRSSVKRAVQR